MPLNYTTALGPLDRTKNDLALQLRRRVFERFMRECRPGPNDRVADFGVSGHRDHPVHYFFELFFPYKDRLTAIGQSAEEANWFPDEFPGLSFIEADLRSIPLPDGYFDAGICNAVVEHAGTRADQVALVREVCRVCRKVLFTTPNKSFPIELHTFLPLVHWLPDPMFRNVLRALGYGSLASVENLNPLGAREFLSLFPPERETRLIGTGLSFMPVNLIAISVAPGCGSHRPARAARWVEPRAGAADSTLAKRHARTAAQVALDLRLTLRGRLAYIGAGSRSDSPPGGKQ